MMHYEAQQLWLYLKLLGAASQLGTRTSGGWTRKVHSQYPSRQCVILLCARVKVWLVLTTQTETEVLGSGGGARLPAVAAEGHSELLAVQSMENCKVLLLCHSASPNPDSWMNSPPPPAELSHSPTFSSPSIRMCNLQGYWYHFCFLPVPLFCRCLSLPLSSSALSFSLSLFFSPTCTLLLPSILI